MTHAESEQPDIPKSSPRWAIRLSTCLAAALFAVGFLHVYSPWETEMGPGRLELKAAFAAQGTSTLNLPPLGDVRANTHDAPLALTSTLTRLDARQVQELIGQPDPADNLSQRIQADLDSALTSFVSRTLGIAGLIGLVLALVVARKERLTLLLSPLTAVIAVGALLGASWRSYDLAAFDQPRFTGSLTEAPRVLDTLRSHVKGFDDARARVAVLSDQIAGFYETTATGPSPTGNEVRILHVSDMHSNPLGFETARQLAESFKVNAIVDTGDVTSFGSPIEARVADFLSGMPVPYYVVPGNHDSPELRTSLAAVPGVQVVDRRVVNISGVDVMGFGDPTFTADNKTSQAEADRAQTEGAAGIAAELRSVGGVEVLAVHNSLLAQEAFGSVPLIISGHAHKRATTERNGTLGLVVGSTGAGGVGVFATETAAQYEAQVLHFRDGRLSAVDYVSVGSRQTDFVVSRTTFTLELQPAVAG